MLKNRSKREKGKKVVILDNSWGLFENAQKPKKKKKKEARGKIRGGNKIMNWRSKKSNALKKSPGASLQTTFHKEFELLKK